MVEIVRANLKYKKDGTFLHLKRDVVLKGTKSNRCGHRRIRVGGKLVYLHRAVFAYHHGFVPAIVDHIDRDPSNNRIENLRAATHSENLLNVGPSRANTSGTRGLFFDKRTERWYGQVCVNGKVRSAKSSKSKREATKNLNALRQELGIS